MENEIKDNDETMQYLFFKFPSVKKAIKEIEAIFNPSGLTANYKIKESNVMLGLYGGDDLDFTLFFISSPCRRQCELLPSLGIHRLSFVNFSHFNLLSIINFFTSIFHPQMLNISNSLVFYSSLPQFSIL